MEQSNGVVCSTDHRRSINSEIPEAVGLGSKVSIITLMDSFPHPATKRDADVGRRHAGPLSGVETIEPDELVNGSLAAENSKIGDDQTVSPPNADSPFINDKKAFDTLEDCLSAPKLGTPPEPGPAIDKHPGHLQSDKSVGDTLDKISSDFYTILVPACATLASSAQFRLSRGQSAWYSMWRQDHLGIHWAFT